MNKGSTSVGPRASGSRKRTLWACRSSCRPELIASEATGTIAKTPTTFQTPNTFRLMSSKPATAAQQVHSMRKEALRSTHRSSSAHHPCSPCSASSTGRMHSCRRRHSGWPARA
eukprot:scaffold630_cov399-Prasinococcus_capsulatus_cf.AAC.37